MRRVTNGECHTSLSSEFRNLKHPIGYSLIIRMHSYFTLRVELNHYAIRFLEYVCPGGLLRCVF